MIIKMFNELKRRMDECNEELGNISKNQKELKDTMIEIKEYTRRDQQSIK